MKSEIEAKIEYQKVIGETNPGGYQPIHFSRVKYKASPDTHIDIRQYQRGYDDEGEEAFYPTKTGFRFLEREFRRVVREYVLVPETYVHPLIVSTCFDPPSYSGLDRFGQGAESLQRRIVFSDRRCIGRREALFDGVYRLAAA